ncbi:hypothetical protein [Cellulophaga lytica]|uniref:DUF7768 domain-containing protein n=1 Tax=Cellulophaga lytica TaxID=979 RepID=UPI003CE4B4A1
MKPVIIESPYAGNVKRNVAYAKECLNHSLSLNEAPLASHLLYTQDGILDDTIPEQRKQGLAAGLAWLPFAEEHIFYIDYGYSTGMLAALKIATEQGKKIVERKIYK